jgi:2-polyprenyl-3-methyl-5-hydroxy-6-metoxy-1,4-benzoquinol methylase
MRWFSAGSANKTGFGANASSNPRQHRVGLIGHAATRVLDLGCGVGRHALLFAEHGFVVEAIDGAAAGLDFARREAKFSGEWADPLAAAVLVAGLGLPLQLV